MNIVELPPPDRSEAIAIAENLLESVKSGEVVAFVAVGIERNDATSMWTGCSERKTNLQVIGALTTLLLHYRDRNIK